ncbi:MAG: ABC transporter ATP-binding protein [Omnitrophica bacterium RIFCSPHIGHO2_02_FULL_51_18]|nr:MAG: ABC transporter ATP-binding protein [Omnitrophica bacterium RIFCSPHIGHO2_02_FULL_51_18]
MSDKKEIVISVKNLTKRFGSRTILSEVSLDIYEGETLVVMGGSGCGKSTFLRHLIGALRPDEGEVWMFGKNIAKADEMEMDEIRKQFGMLFQSGALFDSMTVGENIALPLREHTKLDENIIRIVIKLKLDLVGLRGFENLMPSQLSGGMKKRCGLARAIVMDPKIVFYDEPTAGLDPVMTGVIDKLTMDLTKKLNITSVVVTHDMGSVFRIANRIVMLHEGRVLEIGTPDEIRHSKNPIVQQFITGGAEGPISFVQSGEDYLEHLTEEIEI